MAGRPTVAPPSRTGEVLACDRRGGVCGGRRSVWCDRVGGSPRTDGVGEGRVGTVGWWEREGGGGSGRVGGRGRGGGRVGGGRGS